MGTTILQQGDPIALATAALRTRDVLPADPLSWGRAFGLAPAQAMRLVESERRRRGA